MGDPADNMDACYSVMKEAIEWVRRLAEFAPLLHVADRQEGEAQARGFLKAWDETGGPILEQRARRLEADRAASDAREDRLRDAVERIQSLGCDRINDGKRRACEQAGSMSRCASCIASRALAAIPPRSDR